MEVQILKIFKYNIIFLVAGQQISNITSYKNNKLILTNKYFSLELEKMKEHTVKLNKLCGRMY